MPTKQSFGGGFGINRHLGGASVHAVAKPPMKNVTRNSPGRHVEKHTGIGRPKRKTGVVNA